MRTSIKRFISFIIAALFCFFQIAAFFAALPKAALALEPREPEFKGVPSGYNANDYTKLVNFLETKDSNGIKNGKKLNNAYDPNDPYTWNNSELGFDRSARSEFKWYAVGNEKRIESISLDITELAESACCAGSLDVSGCAFLKSISICMEEWITGLNTNGCTSLKNITLNFTIRIKNLDISTNTALESLYCEWCPLSSLDTSNNSELTCLFLSNGYIKVLDLINNPKLPHDYIEVDGSGYISMYFSGYDSLKPIVSVRDESGASFLGWYNALGKLLSIDRDTENISDLERVLIARFSDGTGLTETPTPMPTAVPTPTPTPKPTPSALDRALGKSPFNYDADTALAAALLAYSTYNGPNDTGIRVALSNYGFESDDIYSNNYGGSLAFTIGVKDYLGSDAEEGEKLIVIAAQGSTNPYELFKDATAITTEVYNGYLVYGIVRDFKNAIREGLERCGLPNGKCKVLLTGHSLGGAAVNYVAAMMNDGEFGRIGKENIYCYTFGAINPILAYSPVDNGYENIHNIYNYYDTFSPFMFGLMLPTGMGTGYGKFGHLDMYFKDHRSLWNKLSPWYVQVADHINHDMDKYFGDVRNGTVEENGILCGSNHNLNTIFMQASLECAADIKLFNEAGELMVNTEGEKTYYNTSDCVSICVYDGKASICVPNDCAYTLEIDCTDGGTMDCLFRTFNLMTGETLSENSFEGIETKENSLFQAELASTVGEVRLFRVDSGGSLREVFADGTVEVTNEPEISFEPTAEPTAIPDNSTTEIPETSLANERASTIEKRIPVLISAVVLIAAATVTIIVLKWKK